MERVGVVSLMAKVLKMAVSPAGAGPITVPGARLGDLAEPATYTWPAL